MATATKKARTATQRKGDPRTSASISMQFLIFEDNGGDYHWRLLDGDRETLAQSPSFASREDAHRAAQLVLDGASSARLERAAGDRPIDAVARRDAALAPDSPDAGRRSNEGGSLNGGRASKKMTNAVLERAATRTRARVVDAQVRR